MLGTNFLHCVKLLCCTCHFLNCSCQSRCFICIGDPSDVWERSVMFLECFWEATTRLQGCCWSFCLESGFSNSLLLRPSEVRLQKWQTCFSDEETQLSFLPSKVDENTSVTHIFLLQVTSYKVLFSKSWDFEETNNTGIIVSTKIHVYEYLFF